MGGLKNLMRRRQQFRCPTRPPSLRMRPRPGPHRAFRVQPISYTPGPRRRMQQMAAFELDKLLKDLEAGMTRRQRRRCPWCAQDYADRGHLGHYISVPIYGTTNDMTYAGFC